MIKVETKRLFLHPETGLKIEITGSAGGGGETIHEGWGRQKMWYEPGRWDLKFAGWDGTIHSERKRGSGHGDKERQRNERLEKI